MLTTSQPCFFLIVSFCYFTIQYQGSAARAGVEPGLDPRKWLSNNQIGASGTNGESRTQKEAITSQHGVTDLGPDRTSLGGLEIPKTKTIPDYLPGGEVNRDGGTYPTLFSYQSGSGHNGGRSDLQKISRRHDVLTNRERKFDRGILASSFAIPPSTNDATTKEVRTNGIGRPRLHRTVTVPTLDLCVHVCLAHALCDGAFFHVQRLTCELRDKMDDWKETRLRHVGVEMHNSRSRDVKIFTVNPTVLTHLIGECADRPCSIGTYCSQSIQSGYTCLPFDKFLRRIQKRSVQREDNNQGLVRRKRSLGISERKRQVDCGLPPKLPRALSLYVNTFVGSSATYYCEEGSHTHTTKTKLHCQNNGKWTDPHFQCVSHIPCKSPRDIPGTTKQLYVGNGKRMVTYSCKINHAIHVVSMCNPRTGTWSPVHPNCTARPQGRKENLAKNRRLTERKNQSRDIGHAKEKSIRRLGNYAALVGSKTQALRNQSSHQKNPESYTRNIKEKSNSIKSDQDTSKMAPKKVNEPKKRIDVSGIKTREKKIEGGPSGEFNTPNPIKSSKKDNEQKTSFTSLKNIMETPQTALKGGSVKKNIPSANTQDIKNYSISAEPKTHTLKPAISNKNTPGKSKVKSTDPVNTTPNQDKNDITMGKTDTNMGITDITMGTTDTNMGITDITVGTTDTNMGITDITMGTTDTNMGITDITVGTTDTNMGITDITVGTTDTNMGITDITVGTTDTNMGINDTTVGENDTTRDKHDTTTPTEKGTSNNTHNNTGTLEKPGTNNTVSASKINNGSEVEYQFNAALFKLFRKNPELFLDTNMANELIASGANGMIRANVNAQIGKPGFKCAKPGLLKYASEFFGSTNIGDKLTFRCNKYFEALPVTYCPIVTCLLQGMWSELLLSCSVLDCLEPGGQYVGRRICADSGHKCKRWDKIITDPLTIESMHFPDGNITLANNYCRDPESRGRPWCYTEDPTVLWDFCTISDCTID